MVPVDHRSPASWSAILGYLAEKFPTLDFVSKQFQSSTVQPCRESEKVRLYLPLSDYISCISAETSKRGTTHERTKRIHQVKESKKKVRKAAKKSPQWKSSKSLHAMTPWLRGEFNELFTLAVFLAIRETKGSWYSEQLPVQRSDSR